MTASPDGIGLLQLAASDNLDPNLLGLGFVFVGVIVLLWLAIRSERRMRLEIATSGSGAVQGGRIETLEGTVDTLLTKLTETQKEVGDLRHENENLRRDNVSIREQLNRANQRIAELEVSMAYGLPPAQENAKRPAKPLLLVQCNQIFGEDDALAIRRVGIPFHRLKNCMSGDLDRYLQAGRQDHTTPWWCQISAHMGADGIQFADGVKTPTWLSQRIRNIRVLVLAGCENEEVGAQLVGLARHVVIVYEAIESQYAQDFSFAFWSAINKGAEPSDAFARALDECPQVSEFVSMRTAR